MVQASEGFCPAAVGLCFGQSEEVGNPFSAGAAFFDLGDGRGEFFGGGNHEDEQHNVGYKKVGGDAYIAFDDQGGAKKEDADYNTVAEEVADGRGEVDTAEHAGAEPGVAGGGLAETAVGEVDGSVCLDYFEADDGFFHERHEEGVALLKFGRLASEAVGDARNDKGHYGKHAHDKKREFHTDVKKHDNVENQAHNRCQQLLERAEGALVVFGGVASKTGEDVAPPVGAEIGDGEFEDFAEKAVAEVAHYVGPDDGDLDQGEVVEDVFKSIETQQQQGEIDQGMLGTEDYQSVVEGLQGLREQGGAGRRTDGGRRGRRKEDFDEIGHGEGCGHGEQHREHHKQPVCHQSGGIGACMVKSERHGPAKSLTQFIAYVVVGGDIADPFFDSRLDIERLDKVGYRLCGHFLIGAGELLEGFVGVGVTNGTKDGLNGFGHDSPVVLQVVIDGLLVEEQFAHALFE